jgi:AraC-like DNA-binding protein
MLPKARREANVEVLEAGSADDWQTVVSGCFVPLQCAGFEAGFTGRMEHVPLADRLTVSYASSSGHIADRTPRLASRASGDDLHISLQVASSGTVAQDGRAITVSPGSITVYSTGRPYHLDLSRSAQKQVVLQISESSLSLPTGMVGAATSRLAIPGGRRSPAGANVFSYLAGLPDGLTEETAEATRDLTRTMIRSSLEAGPAVPRTSAGLRHAVREYLRVHATRPELDMDHLARRHLISRRRMYQVFEKAGLSPASVLRAERLRVAAHLLTDPGSASRTVEQIAYASGFEDPRTLTRAFRRAYGCTPREWRATAGAPAR